MDAFREFKSAWDPGNKMNPGKVVNAFPPTENLRLGADYNPLQPKTHFQFPDDGGSLAKATLRCLGLGACRKLEGGTMCPSYLGTLEEEHSTRGRAHMLFEMLQGEIVNGGWEDENVKKSLDLCLSCKACKTECPANVDVATYKAEFLSHYYERKRRPLHAYAFGMIDRWARLASFTPRLANWAPTAPWLDNLCEESGPGPRKAASAICESYIQAMGTKRKLGSLQQATLSSGAGLNHARLFSGQTHSTTFFVLKQRGLQRRCFHVPALTYGSATASLLRSPAV